VGDADYVVLAAALTPQTHHLFDAAMLEYMRPSAWLINVARGGLIDTDALVRALTRDELGGVGLDVTDPEPLPDDHPLWSLPNAMITPHVANTWAMALPELAALVTRNVEAFASDLPLEGRVDVQAGY
jgi:phosphoglycerate dehydrogenase-like enzyme